MTIMTRKSSWNSKMGAEKLKNLQLWMISNKYPKNSKARPMINLKMVWAWINTTQSWRLKKHSKKMSWRNLQEIQSSTKHFHWETTNQVQSFLNTYDLALITIPNPNKLVLPKCRAFKIAHLMPKVWDEKLIKKLMV